jgi:hypothetical protein
MKIEVSHVLVFSLFSSFFQLRYSPDTLNFKLYVSTVWAMDVLLGILFITDFIQRSVFVQNSCKWGSLARSTCDISQ